MRHIESTSILDQVYQNLPGFVYYKNTYSQNMWSNTYTNMHAKKHLDMNIHLKSNFDIMDAETAHQTTRYESIIMGLNDSNACLINLENYHYENNIHKFEEKLTLINKNEIILQTSMSPIYDEGGEIQGLLGISLDITEQKKIQRRPENRMMQSGLSKRETQICTYLIKGHSATSIALDLNISRRTVESYIENAKNKLICNNKQELIESLLSKYYM